MIKKGYKVSVSGVGAERFFRYYEHSNLNLLDFIFRKNIKIFIIIGKKNKAFIRNPYLRNMKNFLNNNDFYRIINYEIFSKF